MSYSHTEAYQLMFQEYPDVVSIAQLSKMLGVSEKTAYRLLKENQISHFKIGRTYRIPKLHILSFMSTAV